MSYAIILPNRLIQFNNILSQLRQGFFPRSCVFYEAVRVFAEGGRKVRLIITTSRLRIRSVTGAAKKSWVIKVNLFGIRLKIILSWNKLYNLFLLDNFAECIKNVQKYWTIF